MYCDGLIHQYIIPSLSSNNCLYNKHDVLLTFVLTGHQRPRLEDLNTHTQWRQLGEQLKVGDYLINIIEHDHPNDCETCYSKVLTKWLENATEASWESLTAAVNNLSSRGKFDSL